jgi:hypothetical protein
VILISSNARFMACASMSTTRAFAAEIERRFAQFDVLLAARSKQH